MLVKVVLAFVPTVWMAVKQTMTIKANMTAYSTAVGPSSDAKNWRIFRARFFTESSSCTRQYEMTSSPAGTGLELATSYPENDVRTRHARRRSACSN